jgi:thioredoxin reductase (NADPH)
LTRGNTGVHLARFAARVTLLVRGRSLAAGMSDYLIKQLEATSNIEVRPGARVVDARGEARLQALLLEDLRTGRQEVDAAAVFVLIGAEPRTDWLRNVVELDDHEFVLTGRDIPQHAWPLPRAPLPFETSMPGVLAAGDVRHGSVKRVAGAVGEGSVAWVRSTNTWPNRRPIFHSGNESRWTSANSPQTHAVDLGVVATVQL